MSTKIRCVKPEFYRHLGLYQLEQRTRLPIRISFEGLWAVADREGRFRWRAHEIKLDVLPYDEVDFAVILEELTRERFIVHYVVDGEEFGYIPTWGKHQRPNHRERPSQIPAPPTVADDSPVQLELNPPTRGQVCSPCPGGSGSGSGSGGGSGSGSGNGSGGGSGKPAAAEVLPSVQSQNPPLENRPSSITGTPSRDTVEVVQAKKLPPSNLTAEQLALRMMDELSFSGNGTDLQIWADAIKFKARDDGVSLTAAYCYILTKALAAKKAGEFTKKGPTFWMKDGYYDHEPERSKGDVFTKSRSAGKILEQQHLAARAEMLEMLTTFYAAVGNAPETDAGLALMAKLLSARAEPQSINAALERCLVECRYPIRLPDILQRIPGTEAADVMAERRLAWDVVEKFVRKYVSNDVHGNYGPDFGWYGPRLNSLGEVVKAASYPQLSDRILDTVRRTGGWQIYALMTNEDFPFVQKRFFEEYEGWSEVERISDRARLLEIPRVKELVAAKSMEPERPRAPAPAPTAAAAPMSPQKARIMKAIANAGKSMR